MGKLTEMSLKEELGRKIGLEVHINSNFYPPHPTYVKESMIEGFESYWDGEIGLEELTEKCYLRDISGLYRYFEFFLNEEDVCED